MTDERGRSVVWDAFWAVLILAGVLQTYRIWRDALREPVRYTSDDAPYQRHYDHAWRVKGQVREADHATTSAPNYMGTPGFIMSGFDEHNHVIWTVGDLTEYEVVR